MALCKKDVTPLLMHWSYVFLALPHQSYHKILWSLKPTTLVVKMLMPFWNLAGSSAATCQISKVNLTHLPLDEMDAISQTIFSDPFSWMKSFVFWLKFHQSLFLRVQLTIIQHWFRQWLGAELVTSHYLNQWLTWFTDAYMRHKGEMS